MNFESKTLEELLDLLPQGVDFHEENWTTPDGGIMNRGRGLLGISKPNGWVITYSGYDIFGGKVFLGAHVSQDEKLKESIIKTLNYLIENKLINN